MKKSINCVLCQESLTIIDTHPSNVDTDFLKILKCSNHQVVAKIYTDSEDLDNIVIEKLLKETAKQEDKRLVECDDCGVIGLASRRCHCDPMSASR